jgi:hypothetical protein
MDCVSANAMGDSVDAYAYANITSYHDTSRSITSQFQGQPAPWELHADVS